LLLSLQRIANVLTKRDESGPHDEVADDLMVVSFQ
jgi:hypothetical protein